MYTCDRHHRGLKQFIHRIPPEDGHGLGSRGEARDGSDFSDGDPFVTPGSSTYRLEPCFCVTVA
jgi:hypothetical protein